MNLSPTPFRVCVKTRNMNPNQNTFLNAEDAEALAEERRGEHFSASFAKTSASSAL